MFNARDIKDRIVQFPRRYKLKDINTGAVVATYDLEAEPGTITEAGTVINKAHLQPIEDTLKWHGKFSQMSGGSSMASNGIIAYTTEDIDEFNAINISISNTKITIPTGVTRAKFYLHASLQSQEWGRADSIVVYLRKNGTNILKIAGNEAIDYDAYGVIITNCFYSPPINCVAGDYFEIYASFNNQAGQANIAANSLFGMEVLM